MNYITEALQKLNIKEPKPKQTTVLNESKIGDDISDKEYQDEAKGFAEEIKTMPIDEVKSYWKSYNFENHGPEDDAEQVIYDALKARLDAEQPVEENCKEACEGKDCEECKTEEPVTEAYDKLTDADLAVEDAEFAESMNESFEDTLPAHPLGEDTVEAYVNDIPAPAPHMPPKMFKLGYMAEITDKLASAYRGGRGSEGQPKVRVVKCTEYSALYTACDWQGTNATKAADKELGTERHTGEKTGFHYAEGQLPNKIGTYPDGSKALQAYIAGNSKQKVKFFISIDDGDLVETSRDEVAKYMTPANAAKLTAGTIQQPAGYKADTGEAIYDKPINRFKINKIYMIGNLGSSIM